MESMSEPLIFQKLRREVPNERQREFFCSEAMHTAYGAAAENPLRCAASW